MNNTKTNILKSIKSIYFSQIKVYLYYKWLSFQLKSDEVTWQSTDCSLHTWEYLHGNISSCFSWTSDKHDIYRTPVNAPSAASVWELYTQLRGQRSTHSLIWLNVNIFKLQDRMDKTNLQSVDRPSTAATDMMSVFTKKSNNIDTKSIKSQSFEAIMESIRVKLI